MCGQISERTGELVCAFDIIVLGDLIDVYRACVETHQDSQIDGPICESEREPLVRVCWLPAEGV